MSELVTLSVKIPKEVMDELKIRTPEGDRSAFVRDAIFEKLEKTPRPDKLLELENKITKIEGALSEIKKYLAELEILTYDKGKINPHAFCVDDLDHRIVDYLIEHRGATTPELSEALKADRWTILNRLRKLLSRSKEELGKSIITFYAGEREGKKRAWWMEEASE